MLIVDDEPSIRITLANLLAGMGYGVRSAEDVSSALDELRKEIPDLLLTDLDMPGMWGIELLAEVRRSFPAVLTIAMTGFLSGNGGPSGVVADAFIQRESSVGSLLQLMDGLMRTEHERTNDRSTAKGPLSEVEGQSARLA